MAQPTFFLQPLAAAISLACFSTVSFAAQLAAFYDTSSADRGKCTIRS